MSEKTQRTELHQRLESGEQVLIAEVSPPRGSDPAPLRTIARAYAGKVHAIGISDNRDGVCMSALAAASIVAAEGAEPIVTVVTRDRNRIALISDCLGAQALGIRNLFCTTGTHQTLGPFSAAKNVFDLDSTQLLQVYANLANDASVVGEGSLNGGGPLCLGAAAAPNADPLELQVSRLAKKAAAGAHFAITSSVFDLERFEAWWLEVTKQGLHEQLAILAGIEPLQDAASAEALAANRPSPRIPTTSLERIASAGNAQAQRAAGLDLAVETIGKLKELKGLRGFALDGEPETALAIMERTGVGID